MPVSPTHTSLTRQSNIELLRILSMLMVIGLHANFESLGYPHPRPVQAAPWSWLGMIATEQSCISCVDTFVLITGWFGTHFKLRRFGGLLFQVFFISLLMSGGLWLLTGKIPGSPFDIIAAGWHYWFVYSYLLLYLFTPMLNSWVEQCGESGLRRFIILFMVFAIPFSFCLNDLSRGFSAIWFMGLYLLGRYLRLHLAPKLGKVGKGRIALVWGICVAGMTAAYWAHIYWRNPLLPHLPSFMTAYTNPLTVVCAICLLLFFDRLHFRSRLVNWLAAGSLTVYLTHQQAFVRPYFFDLYRQLDRQFSGIGFFLAGMAVAGLIYIASACVDTLRRSAWRQVDKIGNRSSKKRVD